MWLESFTFLFQLFKGIFYYCDGPDAKLVQNKTQCLELSANGNRWVNHKYNFDNLGQALMSLFVLSSKDGWVNIMYQGLDAVGVDQQVSFLLLHSQYGKTTISLFLQKSPFSPRSFQRKKLQWKWFQSIFIFSMPPPYVAECYFRPRNLSKPSLLHRHPFLH